MVREIWRAPVGLRTLHKYTPADVAVVGPRLSLHFLKTETITTTTGSFSTLSGFLGVRLWVLDHGYDSRWAMSGAAHGARAAHGANTAVPTAKGFFIEAGPCQQQGI